MIRPIFSGSKNSIGDTVPAVRLTNESIACARPPWTRRSPAGAATRTRWPAISAPDSQVLPIYEFTTQLATLEAPPEQMQQLLGAVHGNQETAARRPQNRHPLPH
jgi:hypothetical protein